mgnify:CR=1 FL=1
MDNLQNFTKGDLDFFINQNIDIGVYSFLISLICAAILSFLVQIFYLKNSSTLSDKREFSKNFVILGVTTCIVIMIVKSSLALSLGLVGALSIVRFRAAIKEPEELVYLFLIIAIGLGSGANQILITTIGIIFSLTIITIYSKFHKNFKDNLNKQIAIGIIVDQNLSDIDIDNILKDIKRISKELKFISMSRSNENTSINFDVKPTKFEELTKLSGIIKKKYKNSRVILSYNDELSL